MLGVGRRSRIPVIITAVVVVAVLVGGWRWVEDLRSPSGPAVSSRTAVDRLHGADVSTPDGALRVHIAVGGVAGDGFLRVREARAAGHQGWFVELSGTTLTRPATMRFAVPVRPKSEPAPLVQWSDTPGGDLSVARAVSIRDRTLEVRTDHFSFWTLTPWKSLLEQARSWLRHRLDDASRFHAADKAPRCAGESRVRLAGYRVSSDSGERVKWCLGREGGTIVLKVVNARGYGVAAESTPGLRVTATDLPDLVGAIAGLIKPPPSVRANRVDLIPSGDSVTYALDEPELVGVKVDPNAGSYLLSALQYAIDTYTMVTSKVGAPGARTKMLTALEGEQCLGAMSGLATTELGSASDTMSFFGDALAASFDCVSEAAGDIDLGPVLNGIVAPVTWLLEGVGHVANGLVAVGDMLTDLDGYQIRVSPPAVPATEQTVIDPFDSRGGTQPGWSVARSAAGANPLDCFAASPNAVGPGTQWCGWTADAASACWLSPESLPEIWCLDALDPASRTLRVLPADNGVPQRAAPDDPQPLFLELADGSRFWYRTGGAWGGRADGLRGAYGCANEVGVCASSGDTAVLTNTDSSAVDTSSEAWTVRVGGLGQPDERFPSPMRMSVRRAWFMAGHVFGTD